MPALPRGFFDWYTDPKTLKKTPEKQRDSRRHVLAPEVVLLWGL